MEKWQTAHCIPVNERTPFSAVEWQTPWRQIRKSLSSVKSDLNPLKSSTSPKSGSQALHQIWRKCPLPSPGPVCACVCKMWCMYQTIHKE
jgi:hypothetical protein